MRLKYTYESGRGLGINSLFSSLDCERLGSNKFSQRWHKSLQRSMLKTGTEKREANRALQQRNSPKLKVKTFFYQCRQMLLLAMQFLEFFTLKIAGVRT